MKPKKYFWVLIRTVEKDKDGAVAMMCTADIKLAPGAIRRELSVVLLFRTRKEARTYCRSTGLKATPTRTSLTNYQSDGD